MAPENTTPSPKPSADGAKELRRLEEKLKTIDDPTIRAVVLERIVQLREAHPEAVEPEPDPVPEVDEVDEGPIIPPTPEQIEQAETLVRQSQVEKMRGNRQACSDLLRQAVKTAPTAPAVLEALGDDAMSRSNFKEARMIYEKALKVSPKSIALERKHAEAVLRSQTALTIEDQLRLGLKDTPFISSEDMKASRKAATLYNIFLPGMGQIAIGKTQKGAILLGLWVLCIISIVLLRGDLDAMVRSMSGGSGQQGSMFVMLPILVAIVVYIVALADLKGAASEGIHKVDRPKPPVNLPFE